MGVSGSQTGDATIDAVDAEQHPHVTIVVAGVDPTATELVAEAFRRHRGTRDLRVHAVTADLPPAPDGEHIDVEYTLTQISTSVAEAFATLRPNLIVPVDAVGVALLSSWVESLAPDPTLGAVPFGPACPLNETAVAVTSSGSAAICSDLLLTLWALREAGVSVPVFEPWSHFASSRHAHAALGDHVVARPRDPADRTVLHLSNDANWVRHPGVRWVLFSQLSGPGFTVQVSRHPVTGDSVGEVRRKRPGPDIDSEVKRRAEDIACRAVAVLGLTGPAEVEVCADANGVQRVLAVRAWFGDAVEFAPRVIQHLLDSHLSTA